MEAITNLNNIDNIDNNNNIGGTTTQRTLRCPYCLANFEDPNQHFISQHQLRIKDINSILDIEKYVF